MRMICGNIWLKKAIILRTSRPRSNWKKIGAMYQVVPEESITNSTIYDSKNQNPIAGSSDQMYQ